MEVRSRARRALAHLSVALVLASSLPPGVALAADPPPPAPVGEPPASSEPPSKEAMEEARAHYAKGVQLYTDGSFAAALVELDRANHLAPSFKILYSIGLVQLRLTDYAGAKRSFDRYLKEGKDEVTAPRRTEVTGRLKELATRVALVTVHVNEADALVLVDDIAVGTAPLSEPVVLNPGYHKVVATKSGYTAEAKQVGVAGGDKVDVEVQLNAVAPVVAPPPPPPPAPVTPVLTPPAPVPVAVPPPVETPRSPEPAPLWIGWAATGALTLGAVVTGIVALDQSNKLGNEVNQQPITAAEISSTHDKTVGFALATDILAGAAIVAGGVTLYLTLHGKAGGAQTSVAVAPGRLGIRTTF